MDFVAYTDESYITASRFRSIACCSLISSSVDKANLDLREIMDKHGVREFKWEKLKDAKYRSCAEELIDCTLRFVRLYNARIDVIVWDTHDARHTIKNRDDKANFERMFFHLLSASMKRRARSAAWGLYPDEKSEIDWNTVNSCLVAVGRQTPKTMSLFVKEFFTDQNFHIKELKQVESHKHPLSQIADLYAGLSVFSKDKYNQYSKWLASNSPTFDLFESNENEKYSNREKARFFVLRYLDESCKSGKLGLSLKSKGYLHTPNSSNPINFWSYHPQHDYDKAPIKKV